MPDKVEPLRVDRRFRSPLDADDRRAVVQVLSVLVLIVSFGLTFGLAWRAFLFAAGLGG